MPREPENSQGVQTVRFPRTDFPQQGWIRKPTGTLYEGNRADPWAYHADRSFRMRDRQDGSAQSNYLKWNRQFRTDFPQQGWLYKPIVNGTAADLYEAITDYGWYWHTQDYRVYEKPNRYKFSRDFYADLQQQGWLASAGSIAIVWDNLYDRMGPGDVYRRDTNHNQDWLGNFYTGQYQGWNNIDDVRMRQVNDWRHVPQPDTGWINAVTAVTPFDPATFGAIDQLSNSYRYTSLQRLCMAPDFGSPSDGGRGTPPFDPAVNPLTWFFPDICTPKRKGLPDQYLAPQRTPFGLLDVRPLAACWAQLQSFRSLPKRDTKPRGMHEGMEWEWFQTTLPAFDPTLFPHSFDVRMATRKKVLPLENQHYEHIYANQLIFPELTIHVLDTRLRERHLVQRWPEDQTQPGWIFSQVAAFDPTLLIHSWDTRMPGRYKKVPRLDTFSQGWIFANTPTFDPRTLVHWSDDKVRDRYKKTPQLGQPDQSWMFNGVPLFDFSLVPHSVSERMGDRLSLRVQRSNWEEVGLAWLTDVLTLTNPPSDIFTGATNCAGRWGTFNWGDGRWCEDRQLHPYTTDELGRRIYYLSAELVHTGDTDFVIANVTPTLNIKGNLPDKWQAKAGHNDIQYLSIELVHTGNDDFVIQTIRPVIALRNKWRGST